MVTLTSEQLTHFEELKTSNVNEILTESAFTEQDKSDLLKALKNSKDINLYHFLRRRHPTARAIKLYVSGLTRMTLKRVIEADRATQHTSPTSNIKNKIGLSQKSTQAEVKAALKRLSTKSNATWKALNLNKNETLREYGLL